MSWEQVYRIRVFGEPVETPRPRHTIMAGRDFTNWFSDPGDTDLSMKSVLKLLC